MYLVYLKESSLQHIQFLMRIIGVIKAYITYNIYWYTKYRPLISQNFSPLYWGDAKGIIVIFPLNPLLWSHISIFCSDKIITEYTGLPNREPDPDPDPYPDLRSW